MMTVVLRKIFALAAAATVVITASVSSAQTTIYDNSVNDLVYRFNPGTTLVGDEIILAGTQRFITGFSFEYWALANGLPSGSFAGTPEVQVSFYINDGGLYNGYATPGTLLYSTAWFAIPNPTDRNTIYYNAADLGGGFVAPLSQNITWTVQFRNLGGTDTLGVDIYSPPVTGSSYPDYWEFTAGPGWVLKTNSVAMNFASIVQAVPEPSTLTLGVLGGVGFFLLRRRLFRR